MASFNSNNIPIHLIGKYNKGNLYLGSLSAANNLPLLEKYGITHILRLISTEEYSYLKNTVYPKIKYYTIDIEDIPESQLIEYFDTAYEFIDTALKEGGNVLVHCVMGISRSPSVVIMYLMRKKRYGYDRAYKTVKDIRGCVFPNPGFVEQLIEDKRQGRVSSQARIRAKAKDKKASAGAGLYIPASVVMKTRAPQKATTRKK